MKVIADSSFLIALATVDALWLLPRLFMDVTIPDAVYSEVVTKGAGLPGADEVAQAPWITRATVKGTRRIQAYRKKGLGSGEAEVLALAEESKAALVLTDDERAWKTAHQNGIPYLQSIEFLLAAHQKQLLDADTVRSKLSEYLKKRWVSEEVIAVALRHLKKT
jgi:hypothetical protein